MQQQGNTQSHKIATCLIIEDSQFDQQMMARVIARSRQPLNVQVVSTLGAAKKALANGEVSLILLDNNLPDGIGADFALELASHPVHARTPVVNRSTRPTPSVWEKAESAVVPDLYNKHDLDVHYVKPPLGNGS